MAHEFDPLTDRRTEMGKLYALLIVAVLSIAVGVTWFFLISWSEIPEEMITLGVWAYWLFPVMPGVVATFVGAHLVLSSTGVPVNKRLWLAGIQAVFLLGMIVGLYFILTSSLPVRHTAFNWTFYLFPLMYLAYRVESLLWLRHG